MSGYCSYCGATGGCDCFAPPNALPPTEEQIAQIIEDWLFPIFGAGPYEALASEIMRALAKPDVDTKPVTPV